MKPLMSLILLLSLTTLVSCGQQGKTSAKLEVSQNFIVDSNKFGGGLIITGESSTGQKFTLALDNSRGGSVELDQGNWTFTAVAWDGDNNNLKFEGTTYCGMSQANLNSAEADVSISVSSANCNGAGFSAKAPIKKIKTLACGMFYSYNQSTNAFTPVTATAPDNFCEAGASLPVPDEYMNQLLYYRVISSHGINGAINAGFESECKRVANDPLSLPSKSVPFFIRLYKTNSDCTNKLVNTPVYHFPNGLEAGNPSKFDHDFHDMTTAPQARLVLPTSITKRGRSPFMGMIPRILCVNSGSFTDCLPDPTFTSGNEEDVHVSFNDNGPRKQLVLAGLPAGSSCPTSYLNNMNYFGAEGCQIEDGNAYVNFYRNNLTCQVSNEFSSAKDIYFANNNIYILRLQGIDSIVNVYDSKGKLIRQATFAGKTLISIAVDSSETIYANTVTGIFKATLSGSTYTYNDVDTFSFSAMQQLEIFPTGDILIVAGTKNSFVGIHPYNLSTASFGTPISVSGSIKELQYISVESKLYFTVSGSGTDVRHLTWNGSGFVSNTGLYTAITGWIASHKSGTKFYYATTSGIYENGSLIAGSITFSGEGSMVVAGSKFYVLSNVASMGLLKVIDVASPSSSLSLSGVNCTEQPGANTTFTIGTKSKLLNIKAPTNDSVYRIWETGFEMIGRRNVATSNARYYFHELNPHGDEISNGGYLRRPQQMLSPNGIAGFFSDFATCQDLETAVAAAGSNGIVRSQTLFDAFTGEFQTYGVTAKQNVDPLDTYLCEDSAVPGSCNNSADKFSMELRFGALNTTELDDSVLKISCNRKLGTMESLEIKNNEPRRELLKWNTGDVSQARFEVYQLDDDSSEDRAELVKFHKNGSNTFISRKVSASHRSNSVSAYVQEYGKNDGGGIASEFVTRSFHFEESTVTNFMANTHSSILMFSTESFDEIKYNLSFAAGTPVITADKCLDFSTLSTQATISTCNSNFPTLQSTEMSEDALLDLNATSLINFTDSGHPFQDGSVFEISRD